eukprot:CAMPEP_0206297732 /NCGR_PEP_ID=MMETSP0106_2-20121207/6319_1 /ASSEMBLY_ACC=CAM_ASM_000206 /TAXON_ID=81532 /ORGANISM="Acanthoeca-like sp., Strain 10tr" /LENGTH=80 /DNA_ID=CAMNT_0053728397 /DNA_START=544 /DNA_END=783 /DNA_ORIENTATION=-
MRRTDVGPLDTQHAQPAEHGEDGALDALPFLLVTFHLPQRRTEDARCAAVVRDEARVDPAVLDGEAVKVAVLPHPLLDGG